MDADSDVGKETRRSEEHEGKERRSRDGTEVRIGLRRPGLGYRVASRVFPWSGTACWNGEAAK